MPFQSLMSIFTLKQIILDKQSELNITLQSYYVCHVHSQDIYYV